MEADRILIGEDEKAAARGLEYALQAEGFLAKCLPYLICLVMIGLYMRDDKIK